MRYFLCLIGLVALIGCDDTRRNMLPFSEPIAEMEQDNVWIFTAKSIEPVVLQQGITRHIKVDDLFESREELTITSESYDKEVAIVTVMDKQVAISAVNIGTTKVVFRGNNKDGEVSTTLSVTVK